jgi:hypothetical protein
MLATTYHLPRCNDESAFRRGRVDVSARTSTCVHGRVLTMLITALLRPLLLAFFNPDKSHLCGPNLNTFASCRLVGCDPYKALAFPTCFRPLLEAGTAAQVPGST